MPPQQSEFVTQSALLKRGWSLTMIRDFLGDPEKTRRNHAHPGGAPLKLYALERALMSEQSERFQALSSARARSMEHRSVAARGAHARRRKELLAALEALPITVTSRADEALLRDAIENYNARSAGKDAAPASPASDLAFLERIQVNYARHCLTRYDAVLEFTAAKSGVSEANQLIRERILDAIAEVYPHLEEECWRQQR